MGWIQGDDVPSGGKHGRSSSSSSRWLSCVERERERERMKSESGFVSVCVYVCDVMKCEDDRGGMTT